MQRYRRQKKSFAGELCDPALTSRIHFASFGLLCHSERSTQDITSKQTSEVRVSELVSKHLLERRHPNADDVWVNPYGQMFGRARNSVSGLMPTQKMCNANLIGFELI